MSPEILACGERHRRTSSFLEPEKMAVSNDLGEVLKWEHFPKQTPPKSYFRLLLPLSETVPVHHPPRLRLSLALPVQKT